jgi:hypothetical protein
LRGGSNPSGAFQPPPLLPKNSELEDCSRFPQQW